MQKSLVVLLLAFTAALGLPSGAQAQKGKSICDLVRSGCEKSITTHTLEILPQVRSFTNWESVSGGPSVTNHTSDGMSVGLGVQLGINVGELKGMPFDVMVGTQFDSGLGTDFLLQNGDSVSGRVSMYGFGTGVRVSPVATPKFRFSLTVMSLWQLNRGKFDIDDGVAPRSETRDHDTLSGDYTAAIMFFPRPRFGVEVGVGYNGQFNSNNADENARVMFGVVLGLGQTF